VVAQLAARVYKNRRFAGNATEKANSLPMFAEEQKDPFNLTSTCQTPHLNIRVC
jgi:hypothetical protein